MKIVFLLRTRAKSVGYIRIGVIVLRWRRERMTIWHVSIRSHFQWIFRSKIVLGMDVDTEHIRIVCRFTAVELMIVRSWLR